MQHLRAQLEARHERIRLARTRIGDNVRPDAARIEAAQHRQLCIAVRCRIDRTEHLCEQICVWQILLRNSCHWKVESQIDNAVRLEIRKEHLRPRKIAHLERQTLRILANVRPCKNGD